MVRRQWSHYIRLQDFQNMVPLGSMSHLLLYCMGYKDNNVGSRSSYDSSSSFGNLLFYSFAGDPFLSWCWYYYHCFSIFWGTVSYVVIFYFSSFHRQFPWQKILDLQNLHHQMVDSSALRMLSLNNLQGRWRNQTFSFQYWYTFHIKF